MTGFIEGENRTQAALFPEQLDDYIVEDNDVRVIDVFIDSIDLSNKRQYRLNSLHMNHHMRCLQPFPGFP